MLRTPLTARVVAVGLLALASAPPAAGQTWTGATSNSWNVGSNWSSNPALPAGGIDTQLIFGTAVNTSPQNNIPGTFLLNRLTIDAGAPLYHFQGNPLDFRTSSQSINPVIFQNSATGVTFANNMVLTNRLTVGGTGTGTVTLGGTLSGAGGLTMSGAGTVLLGGGSNSFAGNVEVNSGSLRITSPTAIPGGRSVFVRQGAEFRIDPLLSGNNAAAPINLLGLSGGTFRVPSGSAEYYIDQLVVSESGGAPGAINFGGSSNFRLHLTGAGGVLVAGNTTWTGGGTSHIQNDGAAPVDIVTNGSTITNGIRLANGTNGQGFRLAGGGTMALTTNGNSAHLIADGFTLEVASMAHLGSGTVTLQQTGTGDPGTLKYTGPTATSSKSLVLGTGGGRVWVSTPDTNLTLSGTISESAAGQQLVVSGNAFNTTLTLTGANTYTGPTVVESGGVLRVASLPDGGVAGPVGASTGDPANLVLGANGSLTGLLEYTGPTAATNRGLTVGVGNSTGSVAVTEAGTNLTVTGQVTGVRLIKYGPGTLTLGNGTNNFTGGVSIPDGVLAITQGRAIPRDADVLVGSDAEFRIAFGGGSNAGAPIGTLRLVHGTFAVPTPGSTVYFLNRLEQGPGGAVNLTGSTDFWLHLTGSGAGVSVEADGTWTGAGTSRIRNEHTAPIDLSIAPGATLTSSILLANGNWGEGFRLTGGGTLAVTNTTNTATLTVGPATLQVGDVAALGTGALTFDGGALAYTGPTATSTKSFTLAAGGGTVSVTDPAVLLFLDGAILGGNTLTKTGPGTLRLDNPGNSLGGLVVDAGRVELSNDAALGTGPVVVNPAGALLYRTTTTTARTFTLNGGTLEVSNGNNLTLNGATVNGGFLAGYGTGKFVLTNSSAVNGATLFGGTTVDVNGPAAFTNVTTGANVTVAAGQTLTLNRGRQTSAGTMTINGNVIAAGGWESTGVLRVIGGSNPGRMTVGGSPLVLGGGSRTYVGANAAGQRGGTIHLGGQTLELNGGLLVNNGDFIAPGNGGIQGGAVNVNYGSLAKGTGYYDEVNVTDGGKFAPGNSITDSGVGALTLNSGSVYEFEINLANGAAGGGGSTPPQGWDRLSMNRLTVNATPESPAVIQLVTRNAADTGPGTLPDFDPAQSYRWQAFQAEVFDGFSPDKFTFDTTGFANLPNPAGVGTFSLERTGSSVFVTYAPVPEPGLMLAVAAAGLAAGRLVRRVVTRATSRGGAVEVQMPGSEAVW